MTIARRFGDLRSARCLARTAATLACGAMALLAAGCSSNSTGNPADGSSGGTGAGGSGATGNPAANTCGATPTLLYAATDILNAITLDDTSVYFVEGLHGVSSIPKTGGAPTSVATGRIAIFEPHMYQDGGFLYFTDNSDVFKVDIRTGSSVSLATSGSRFQNAIDSGLALDTDYVYFGDEVEGMAGEPQGTVNRVPKAGGAVTTLASAQAGPGSIALDDSQVYWVNNGTSDSMLNVLHNGGLGTVAKAGGTPQALFTVNPDGSGLVPGFDLVLSSTDIYFASVNLDQPSNIGAYKLAKSGGTPVKFSNYSTLSGFVLDGSLYEDNGDRIAKFDLATGAKTDIVCFPSAFEGSISMAHDATRIYYIKSEPTPTGSTVSQHSIYSVPLQ
jgi:hypothetical protein